MHLNLTQDQIKHALNAIPAHWTTAELRSNDSTGKKRLVSNGKGQLRGFEFERLDEETGQVKKYTAGQFVVTILALGVQEVLPPAEAARRKYEAAIQAEAIRLRKLAPHKTEAQIAQDIVARLNGVAAQPAGYSDEDLEALTDPTQ